MSKHFPSKINHLLILSYHKFLFKKYCGHKPTLGLIFFFIGGGATKIRFYHHASTVYQHVWQDSIRLYLQILDNKGSGEWHLYKTFPKFKFCLKIWKITRLKITRSKMTPEASSKEKCTVCLYLNHTTWLVYQVSLCVSYLNLPLKRCTYLSQQVHLLLLRLNGNGVVFSSFYFWSYPRHQKLFLNVLQLGIGYVLIDIGSHNQQRQKLTEIHDSKSQFLYHLLQYVEVIASMMIIIGIGK